ncbi:MAG: BamA/TamA family outer membrane protein [Ignavibacteriales bacterium]|nr:BamA/TamA family outer membrane protein [Ignavibacteriales bacterium]
MNSPVRLMFFALLLAAVNVPSRSQTSLRELEVTRVAFAGNDELNSDALRAVIETRQTPGFLSKLLGKISSSLGDEAGYFDPGALESDLLRLRQYYRDQGFFLSSVDTSLQIDFEDRSIDITFRIVEGRRSFIDTLLIRGLDALPTVLLADIQDNRLLHVGDPYTVDAVEQELRRIVTSFANHGYVRVQLDEPVARRYASTNNVTLVWTFHPNERYSFGAITVAHDTTVRQRVEDYVVTRHLEFAPGDFYSEERKIDSERNLNRLGVFEATRIEPLVEQRSMDSLRIPMRIFVRPRAFHELTPEIGVNDENSAFNVTTGIGYSNRNFFGGARSFTVRTRIGLQSIQDVNFSRILNQTGLRDSSLISRIELSSQVVQPYLFSNKVRLTTTLSAMLEKQKNYFAPIYQARIGVDAQLARFTRGAVEFNLERVDPRSFTRAGEAELSQREGLTPQFNSIINVSLQRDKRNDLFSPSSGFFHSGSIEESGLIPTVFGGVLGSRLPYSNYFKISAVGQWYWTEAGGNLIWAGRLRGGYSKLYRGTVEVPITRKFFAGGSESVRGWRSRELGAVPSPNEGGKALMEANLEARWHLFRGAGRFWFLDPSNISLVGFVDAGNIWTDLHRVRSTEIAAAVGLGLRWDTIAGPIRIDFGLRMYDPFDASGRKWIFERRFFHDTYSLVHFGIGHAF